MRRITLKMKLTLVYTLFMVLLTCAALAILFSLSSREVLSSVQSQLEDRVQESLEDIRLRGGELSLSSDFYSVTSNVYLSLYDEDMYFLYGKVPHGFDLQPEFSDGEMRTIRDGSREWYVYDISFRLSAEQTVYVRGVTSVTDAEESFTVTLRFALILLPMMVLATAFIGYRFTRRTLLPVKKITRTVQEIRADADLSRRINLAGGPEKTEKSGGVESGPQKGKRGTGKSRDEIYTLADTFDDMLSELEQVFNREKQFTSDVSHELRTPVSVILAQCGALLADEGLSEKQKEEVRTIERKAENMSNLISQLLFLSRADQGRQPVHPEMLNLSELTEMTVEEQQMLSEAEGRSVRVTAQIQPDIYAWVDETFYIRVLVNLISNARRYSRENGEVLVTLTSDGKRAEGCVEDHGTGISESALPHIWERFYRVDSARSGGDHSGLGLSMVKWMVEAHGGSVSAWSREGEGSKFMFRLPLESGSDCNYKIN